MIKSLSNFLKSDITVTCGIIESTVPRGVEREKIQREGRNIKVTIRNTALPVMKHNCFISKQTRFT